MSLTQGFCPKCGAPTDTGGLCGKCRAKDMTPIEIAQRVECTLCPTCSSIKTNGMWSDTVVDRNEIAYNIVNASIKIHPDVKNVQKSINIVDISSNRSQANVLVTGNIYGVEIEAEQKVKFVWIREQCDRCSRIAGSYYEGVIQVRATGRKPTEFELHRAEVIAYQLEDSMQTSGDRLSFVSDIDETKDGIDITFSSQAIGSAISHDIIGALGGTVTTHPKLVGEKAGVRIYRVTYSIRLPRFSKGDIIKHENEYFQILRQTKETLFVRDLKTGLTRSFREDDSDPLLGNIRTAESATIIYKDSGIAGLLEKNEHVAEAADYGWLSLSEGNSVLYVQDKDNYIIIGVNESEDYSEIEPEENLE